MRNHTFEKLNFRSKFENHYLTNENNVVETKTHDFNYISISWKWHPEDSKLFNKSIQLLEWMIFTIKFKLKSDPPEGFFDFFMPPSEATRKNLDGKRDEWKRKVSLPVPKFVSEERVTRTRRIAQAKTDEKLAQVKYNKGREKNVIQVLHVGWYNSSKRTVNKLHSYAKKHWLEIKWDYQEMYLNDLRRTQPDKLETIIRYEVKKGKKSK